MQQSCNSEGSVLRQKAENGQPPWVLREVVRSGRRPCSSSVLLHAAPATREGRGRPAWESERCREVTTTALSGLRPGAAVFAREALVGWFNRHHGRTHRKAVRDEAAEFPVEGAQPRPVASVTARRAVGAWGDVNADTPRCRHPSSLPGAQMREAATTFRSPLW